MRNTGKTDEFRRELDELGIRWQDCPELYMRNADGMGLSLPVTRFWCKGFVCTAREQISHYVFTPSGRSVVTEIRFVVEPCDSMEFVRQMSA